MSKLPWLVIVAPLLVACQERERQLVQDLPLDWGRRECPKEWYWESLRIGDDSLQVIGAEGHLTGPGPIQNVPEFNDCQKFVVDDGNGSLVYSDYFAIFAVYDSSFSSRRREPGILSKTAALAMLDSLREDPAQRPQVEDSLGFGADWAIPAAEIAAWVDYDTLGIKAGFNCLYLSRAGGRWAAEMVAFGDVEQDCSEPNPNPGSGKQLGVQWTGSGFQDADYPPVARWDWDERSRLHYIGIKCGAAWCEVHAPHIELTPSRTVFERAHIPDPGAPTKERRTTVVKGWYDEQFLAVSSAGNQLAPGRILGAIVPDPELGDRNSPDSYANHWVLAAQVILTVPEGVNNPYTNKFNLSATPNPAERLNQIYLCSFESGGSCDGAEGVADCNDGDEEWRAKIVRAADSAEAFRCVRRCNMDAEVFLIPGAARWRWRVDDEGMWMRCRNGCCEVT